MNKPIDISGVVLRTPRLLLRPWREIDLEDLYAYARVDGVGQMAGWLPHRDLGESRRILDMFIREKKTFALERDGRVIGSLGIETYDEAAHPELDSLLGREIGYVLSKEYWGQGLMPEAVGEVVRYLFEVKGLDFIMCGHFDFNRRSARVIEKCGFRYVKSRAFETSYGKAENCLDYILYNPNRDREA